MGFRDLGFRVGDGFGVWDLVLTLQGVGANREVTYLGICQELDLTVCFAATAISMIALEQGDTMQKVHRIQGLAPQANCLKCRALNTQTRSRNLQILNQGVILCTLVVCTPEFESQKHGILALHTVLGIQNQSLQTSRVQTSLTH